MRSAVANVLLACTVSFAGALVELPVASAQDDPAALVLVVDGAAGRLSVARLRRALSSVLGRPIVRATDPEAAGATGIMTMAFTGPRTWTVRVDEGENHAARSIDVRGPALEVLIGIAVGLLHDAEESEATPRARTTTSGTAARAPTGADGRRAALVHPWDGPIIIGSEILDPFAGMPLSRVSIAAVGELLDPFAAFGTGIRAADHPEVLDPWR